MTLTVVGLAKNEASNIEACIASAAGADEILVIDDHSQDNTAELALKMGARVVTRALDDFASQMNFAASQAGSDWIFILDSDERFTPGLMDQIRSHMAGGPKEVGAVRRKNFAFGRRHRFGPLKPDRAPRLFPKGAAVWRGLVHAKPHFDLPEKDLGWVLHYTYKNWDHYFQKLDQYAGLWAQDAHRRGRRVSTGQTWLRLVWNQFKMFFINLGIMGGPVTWILCFLNGEYTLKKYLKLMELNQSDRDKAPSGRF